MAMNRGKSVLDALASAPRGTVQVMPAPARGMGGGQFGFQSTHPAFATLADELTQWAHGDLSFIDGRMGPPPADKGKRKRDAMADVLDGKK